MFVNKWNLNKGSSACVNWENLKEPSKTLVMKDTHSKWGWICFWISLNWITVCDWTYLVVMWQEFISVPEFLWSNFLMTPQMFSIEEQLCSLMVFFGVEAELYSMSSVQSFPSPQLKSLPLLLPKAGESWCCLWKVIVNPNIKRDLISCRRNYSY